MAPSSLTFTRHHKAYPSIDPTKAELLASSKTVLITGGGRGIGAAIAESFAQANASNIIIVGRNHASLNEVKFRLEGSYSTQVHILPVDITQKLDLEKALTTVTNKIGHVDVLIQNAGYLHDLGPIDSVDVDEFWRTFEVNVKGWQIVLQAFLKVATTHATVISLTSFLGWVPPSIYATAGYAASKAALDKLIQYLSTERPDLRVFSLNPGGVVTDMMVKCGVDTVALADSLNEGEFFRVSRLRELLRLLCGR